MRLSAALAIVALAAAVTALQGAVGSTYFMSPGSTLDVGNTTVTVVAATDQYAVISSNASTGWLFTAAQLYVNQSIWMPAAGIRFGGLDANNTAAITVMPQATEAAQYSVSGWATAAEENQALPPADEVLHNSNKSTAPRPVNYGQHELKPSDYAILGGIIVAMFLILSLLKAGRDADWSAIKERLGLR